MSAIQCHDIRYSTKLKGIQRTFDELGFGVAASKFDCFFPEIVLST